MAKTMNLNELEKRKARGKSAPAEDQTTEDQAQDDEGEDGDEGEGDDGESSGERQARGRRKTQEIPHNGYDPEAVGGVLEELRELDAKLERLTGSIKAEIKAVYTRAADVHSIPTKLLKIEVTRDRQERKRLKKIAGLEDTEKTQLELMQKALGAFKETPLGQAAMASAGNA
jgi:hypothetical protein